MTSTEPSMLRDLPQPNLNDILKSNSYSAIKLLKTAGEFIHKVSVIKEQTAHQLLSAVESFRRKGADMKKDRCALSSAFSSWETILGEYENEAQDMLKLSSKLKQASASVCEDAHRKKMLCKRLFGFRENFENTMDKADETLQKEHTRYNDACSKLTKSQNAEPGKFNQLVKRSGSFHSPKGSSIRLRPNNENEKAEKQEHLVALCRNSHNNYVLQLKTFNNMNQEFYKTALPQILDDLQEIQEQVTCSLVDTFQECAKIEKDKLLENVKRLDNIGSIVELVDAKTDIKIFVQGNQGDDLEIPKRIFVKPEEIVAEHLPDNKLHLDNVTEPALKRKYVAIHKKTKDIELKIKKGEGTFRGVKTLRDSYISNPTYGNAAEMADDILRQKNELRTLQWWLDINRNQALVFADVLDRLGITEEDLEGEWSGDEESVSSSTDGKRQSISIVRGNKRSHQFVEHSYKRPTFCHYCKKVMKGFVKQGMRCDLCRMNVHRKCKDNVQYCRGSYAARKGKLSHGDSLSDGDEISTPKQQRRPKSGTPSSDSPDVNRNAADNEDPEDYYDAPDNLLTSELYCVAMYDYGGDNDGDLRMSAGDKIRVLNSADENWWEGSCKGQTGFFPASYVQLIEKDDVILRCLYDFTGQEGDELTMEAEQIIILINDEDNGWMTGRNGSVDGAFPATYVEVIKDNGPD